MKSDFFDFCDFLADEAEAYEHYQPLPEYVRMNQGKKKKNGKDDNPSLTPFGGSTTSGNDRQQNILPKCLNRKCNKRHLVKACVITKADEKERILAEMRAQKAKKKNSSKGRVAALLKKPAALTQNPKAVEDNTNSSASRSAAVLSELHGNNFACRIDSGANEMTILDTIIKFLHAKAIFLPTLCEEKTFR